MGELVESDPELYQADVDAEPKKRPRGGNTDLTKFSSARAGMLDCLYDGDSDRSLVDEED